MLACKSIFLTFSNPRNAGTVNFDVGLNSAFILLAWIPTYLPSKIETCLVIISISSIIFSQFNFTVTHIQNLNAPVIKGK